MRKVEFAARKVAPLTPRWRGRSSSPIEDGPPDREYSLFGLFNTGPGGVGLKVTLEGAGVDMAIDNTGSTTHTFTGQSRGSNSAGNTIAILAANQGVLINGKGVAQVTIDSGDSAVIVRKGPRGTVTPFRVGNAGTSGTLGTIDASVITLTEGANATGYLAPNTTNVAGMGLTETQNRMICPKGGIIANFWAHCSANTQTEPMTLTLLLNGNPTSLTVTFPAANAGKQSDLAHSVTVAAGDEITVRVTYPDGAGSGTITAMTWGMTYT